ncbi:hypothetical protein TNCV_1349961 [Trichonephila clavipes]|nr:hypothetical protein TNCV_1349961 [Trichonephila clavipes]
MIHLKRQLGANQLARLCVYEPIADTAVNGLSHSPPCGVGIDRHALTSPSVIHCQFFELFGARRSTASKLASLCTRAPAARKEIVLLEGRSSSPVQTP